VIRFMYRMLYNPKRSPEQVARQLTAALGPADQKLLAQPEILEPISAHFKAGMNRGLEPLAEDVIVTAQPWGFELEKIEVPIELWYGTADLAAPLSMGDYLKQHLPKATLHIVEGQGHLLIISRWRDILASAVGAHAVATEPT
jgi:pimeloyl-ACP methyl ester carboxylesterase